MKYEVKPIAKDDERNKFMKLYLAYSFPISMYMLFVYAHNMLSSLITLTRSRLLGINNTCRDTYTQLKFCASNALFCCIYMGLAEIYTMCVSACVCVDVNVWGIFFFCEFSMNGWQEI